MPFAVRTRADDVDKHASDITCMIYHKDKLYSGADDGKIKVWEEDLKLISTVDAHQGSIYSVTVSDEYLYSCANDGKVKMWSLDNLKEKGTLVSDESEYWKVYFANKTLFAGNNEGNIKAFIDGKLEYSLSLLEPIKDMKVLGNLLYTAYDRDLVISEIHPGHKNNLSTRHTIMGRAPIAIIGNTLLFISRSGKDIIMHENSTESQFKEINQIKDAHELIINGICPMEIDGQNFVFTGGWDKVLKQWSISQDTLTHKNSCTLDMTINVISAGPKGELYAGGSDGHIVRVDL